MIIYEVNIKIPYAIFDSYIVWLKNHIKEMLTIDGFVKNKIYIDQSKNKNNAYVCVHYYIKSVKYYDLYIKNKSAKMRNVSNKNFNDKIEINRRVLNEIDL